MGRYLLLKFSTLLILWFLFFPFVLAIAYQTLPINIPPEQKVNFKNEANTISDKTNKLLAYELIGTNFFGQLMKRIFNLKTNDQFDLSRIILFLYLIFIIGTFMYLSLGFVDFFEDRQISRILISLIFIGFASIGGVINYIYNLFFSLIDLINIFQKWRILGFLSFILILGGLTLGFRLIIKILSHNKELNDQRTLGLKQGIGKNLNLSLCF